VVGYLRFLQVKELSIVLSIELPLVWKGFWSANTWFLSNLLQEVFAVTIIP